MVVNVIILYYTLLGEFGEMKIHLTTTTRNKKKDKFLFVIYCRVGEKMKRRQTKKRLYVYVSLLGMRISQITLDLLLIF